MLENSGSFLNEATSIFRASLEHVIEAPLADDDVHLTAQTRVREQFLNIEQSAVFTIDRIFARTVTEQCSANGDSGVFDGQSAIGVVDGQKNLCAAEGAACGGARKDNVFHLAATQGLCALLTHHPGECVDDVGLS